MSGQATRCDVQTLASRARSGLGILSWELAGVQLSDQDLASLHRDLQAIVRNIESIRGQVKKLRGEG